MTTIEDNDHIKPGEIGSDGDALREAAAGGTSWMSKVRAERDERVKEEVLKLGMPTWSEDGDRYDMVVHFGVVERKELEDFQRVARKKARQKNATGESDSDIAFLTRACREIWLRVPEDLEPTDPDYQLRGTLVRVQAGNPPMPVKFEKQLGEMLKCQPEDMKDSRSLLLYLVKGNGVALGSLALKVARWMTDTSQAVEGEILGE